MVKIKSLANSLLSLTFAIYSLGISVAASYFTYQDIKEHDSYARYFFVSPLMGAAKSAIWPYYALRSTPNSINSKSEKAFFNALDLMQKNLKKVSSHDEFLKVKDSMKTAEKILVDCDESELDLVYPGWGTGSTLLKSYVRSFNKTISRDVIVEHEADETDRYLAEFKSWLSVNWDPIRTKVMQDDHIATNREGDNS